MSSSIHQAKEWQRHASGKGAAEARHAYLNDQSRSDHHSVIKCACNGIGISTEEKAMHPIKKDFWPCSPLNFSLN
eukprot:1157320-Pelagomonas_calceolata.AAC.7